MYTTGTAANMDAVKTALVSACTSDGWTSQADAAGKTVLSKSGIYVRVESLADGGDGNPALAILGRTSLDGGDAPGVVMAGYSAFPVTYHAFTFTNEVFFIYQANDIYMWCAFGQSDQAGLPGTGNWVGATFGGSTLAGGSGPITITSSLGGYNYENTETSAALFWATIFYPASIAKAVNNNWMHNGFEASYPWFLAIGGTSYTYPIGIKYLTELLDTQPNAFNSESVLLPIRAYKKRPDSKVSQVLEVKNARHIRNDNYNNEQIITLGTDNWMIFPYYKKNTAVRDGGSYIYHTGTFGWAIKKE